MFSLTIPQLVAQLNFASITSAMRWQTYNVCTRDIVSYCADAVSFNWYSFAAISIRVDKIWERLSESIAWKRRQETAFDSSNFEKNRHRAVHFSLCKWACVSRVPLEYFSIRFVTASTMQQKKGKVRIRDPLEMTQMQSLRLFHRIEFLLRLRWLRQQSRKLLINSQFKSSNKRRLLAKIKRKPIDAYTLVYLCYKSSFDFDCASLFSVLGRSSSAPCLEMTNPLKTHWFDSCFQPQSTFSV